jgi:hypothetical protein
VTESGESSPLATWVGGHSRRFGCFILLLGWGIAAWGYLSFLRGAAAHKPLVIVPGVFAVLVAVGALGLILLLGGRRAVDTLRRKGLGRLRYYAFLVCCLVLPGFLAFMWLRHMLTLSGYD